MTGLYRAVALGGGALVVLGALWSALRHRERPFSLIALVWVGGGAATSLAIYTLVLDARLKASGALWLLAAGAVAGLVLGWVAGVQARPDGLFLRRAGWFWLPPAVAAAAAQITGSLEAFDGFVVALAGLYAATGFTIAVCLLLGVRGVVVRASAGKE